MDTEPGADYGTLLQGITGSLGPRELEWGFGYATTSHYMWGQEGSLFLS